MSRKFCMARPCTRIFCHPETRTAGSRASSEPSCKPFRQKQENVNNASREGNPYSGRPREVQTGNRRFRVVTDCEEQSSKHIDRYQLKQPAVAAISAKSKQVEDVINRKNYSPTYKKKYTSRVFTKVQCWKLHKRYEIEKVPYLFRNLLTFQSIASSFW